MPHTVEAVNSSSTRMAAHATCRMGNYGWGRGGRGTDVGRTWDGAGGPLSRPRPELSARKGQGLTSSREDTSHRNDEDSETRAYMALVSGRTLPETFQC